MNKFHGDRLLADGFNRLVELDAALVDLEALRLQRVSEIGGGHRTEKLVGLSGLAREFHGHLVEQGSLLLAEFISRSAKLAYPIRDGIPIMLPEEARKIE